jgi:guanylate kinase
MLLDIDVQGARHLKRSYREAAVAVMIFPPSWDELERRLRARRTEDDATVLRRLTRAREEAQALLEYDYWLVNRDVPETITRLEAIVTTERAKVARIIVEDGVL